MGRAFTSCIADPAIVFFSSRATFGNNAKLWLSPLATATDGLSVTGLVSVSGTVTVKADSATVAAMVPGTVYKILSWGTRTGVGSFVLDSGLSNVMLAENDTSLGLVKVNSGDLVWKGNPANNVWDFSTANWIGGGLYADWTRVSFTDASDAGTEDVVISAPVSPAGITVSGMKNYTFSGAKISGFTGIDKSGASTLTLNNAGDFTGTIRIPVNGGAVVQNGTLAGASVSVAPGSAFTNAANAQITGGGRIVCSGAYSTGNPRTMIVLNCEDNGFSGGVWGADGPNGDIVAATWKSLGTGTIDLWSGIGLTINGNGASHGADQKLTIRNNTVVFNGTGETTWKGNIELPAKNAYNGFTIKAFGGDKSVVNFGTPDTETTVVALNVYGISENSSRTGVHIHWYSHLLLGENELHQTNGHTTDLHHENNVIGKIRNQQGTILCHATNTLGHSTIKLSQVYQSYKFDAFVDLNGYDQTIKAIDNPSVLAGSRQIIKSAKACVLTVSNDVDSVTAREQGDVQGALTLRKAGSGTWTTHEKNSSSGDFIVAQGTLAIAEDDVLPRGSKDSRLTIADGAKVAVASGVNATVPRMTLGTRTMLRGVYGGTGCTVAGAQILPDFFAPGEGAVTVTRGDGGMTLIIR